VTAAELLLVKPIAAVWGSSCAVAITAFPLLESSKVTVPVGAALAAPFTVAVIV